MNKEAAWIAWVCESCLTYLPLLTGSFWVLLGSFRTQGRRKISDLSKYLPTGCWLPAVCEYWTNSPPAPHLTFPLHWIVSRTIESAPSTTSDTSDHGARVRAGGLGGGQGPRVGAPQHRPPGPAAGEAGGLHPRAHSRHLVLRCRHPHTGYSRY